MQQVVIEYPVLNSPFAEPQRHFRFDDDGITDDIIDDRRTSSYFVPIVQPRKNGSMQLKEHVHHPDFVVVLDDGHGPDDLLNLIFEVTSQKKKDKAAKVATGRTLWLPAVNNHGGLGRWELVEISDPWASCEHIRNAADNSVTP